MQAAASRDTPASVSFYGIVKDHHDALLLITAARFGLIPRFRRRLYTSEQDVLIYSGSVFLWTEEESSIKRWTDGYPWSPSRVHHEFLLYREMAERGCARLRTSSRVVAATDTGEESERPYDDRRRKAIRVLAGSLFNNRELESLVGLSTSGAPRVDDVFKRGGLMKKTFSLSLPGETWHVVSYYTLEDALTSRLLAPKESQFLKGLRVPTDVQSCRALSLRRLALGTSMQCGNEMLLHYDTSSQVPHACALEPDILASVSGSTDTGEWFNTLGTTIENITPCPPPPLPEPCTTSRSGEDRRHVVPNDVTAATWYNLT